MKRILLIIVFLIVLIGFDVWSKDYIENQLAYNLCVSTNTPSTPSKMLGGYFPEIECDRDDTLSIYQWTIRQDGVSVLGDWLKVRLSYNSGIAFSLPITWLPLQILTLLALLWIIIYYIREEYVKNSRLLDTGYILILAWAISHAYERIFVGHVVDFIAVKYFAILNFADIFISIGAFLVVYYYGVYERKMKSHP